ncbi:putative glycine dehydrogenase (decarboxylating) subunit 1 [Gemmata obscuriglobus]|uniref:Probable glycine dehydrogenase (decarboxylating) subunit 1 n=1 Tax=Gemmata obscuriglobus TaxID=114 RepID=A0A2Z3GZJ0_9BACT|nr:aminomethyl-transferring glycine dehydrogenase subunit GcvPA [Gemmata obscuriglobus]AWM36275.1 aminomethyl-transferring glycine dehydrogenase [Gemmata obscuriglobus]QEG31120.1 putative glycine dehydrogenase (decarboxylating) subunit 1 [Gemmata obscuriglobus]VTS10457.1 glycine dehydrogenase subunit 1 : Probable glycine dehydrogenase (decarboxylating) subunit 1 OS=Singulisphaera acidiphila (strain ATCC BAA-1392 / DSM 18658 / VKM B-2454 / MOB10) GN=gcvPA PE=3 SV=1: GDC-P [Gemmata obscuriglobus U
MSYVLNTPDDQKAMLAAIGVSSVEELFANIPPELRLPRELNVPAAMSEMELQAHLSRVLAKNKAAGDLVCFLGGGAYDHFIPSVVDVVAGRSEFYTAYTPYQAEASQGTLQAVFEYQSLMCELTGLGLANASLYEGGSSVVEAALMALGITKRTEILIADSVHPEYRQTLATYAATLNCTVRTIACPDGVLNPADVLAAVSDKTACVIAQSPNFFGHIEDMKAIGAAAHKTGALFVASFDPVSQGLLKKPAEYGADIAVAEGQGLGVPLQYGGPYLGILACHDEMAYRRKIPGRIVGETTDRNGKRSWVLTLQPREQHIAREKATSNICSNQGLLALRAAVYLSAVGPQGLKETAELCVRKAHYAAEQLTKVPGVSLRFQAPFVKEFTLKVPGDPAAVLAKLRAAGYHAGLPLGRWYPGLADCVSVAVTEKRTKAEIDGLAEALKASI